MAIPNTSNPPPQGWHFPVDFDHYRGTIVMVHGPQDIAESLQILCHTHTGERVLLPHYGCDLTPLAFNALTENLKTMMVNNLKQAIGRYEKRVKVNHINLYTPQEENGEGQVQIDINYTIIQTGETNTLAHHYKFE